MSNAYHPRQQSAERDLAALVGQALGTDFEFVSVTLSGKKVVLEGIAPSYIAKAKASETVRRAGFPLVENCLRVVPGMPAEHD